MSQKITPFLWFDNQAEEAMNLYVKVFKDAKIVSISRFPENSEEEHIKELGGRVMQGVLELFGQQYYLMDGGPLFKFNESVSFYVECEDQAEVDEYWNALTTDGGEESQCGWLKDKFGLSWQIIPKQMGELMSNTDPEKGAKVVHAMMQMKKIVIADLEAAANS